MNCDMPKTNKVIYKVVLQTDGRDLEVLYWHGALSETIILGRKLAVELDADLFQIIDFEGTGADVYFETRPFER